MKVALLGATGYVGKRLLAEALNRGHVATAIARNIESIPETDGVKPLALDLTNPGLLRAALNGHDVVIIAVKCLCLNQAQLLESVRTSSVPRTLLIGGAGSLQLSDGTDLVDSGQIPEQYRGEALAAREWLKLWRQQTDINWTFISPSALLLPGERTGRFRLGGDQLLLDANGKSSISLEDFSIAVIDEVENARHIRQRFTVGY